MTEIQKFKVFNSYLLSCSQIKAREMFGLEYNKTVY